MTTNEIIAKRLERIESIPDRFIKGVSGIQSEIFAELLALISELGIGANYQLTETNLIKIDTIIDEYYQVLKDGKYGSYVNWYVEEMKNQQILNDDFFKTEFNVVASQVSRNVYNVSRSRALRTLIGDEFKTDFINVVKDTLIGSVQGGADFKELKSDLFGLFHETNIEPQMERWVKGIASDTFTQSDRAYNVSIAIDLDLQFFEYSGGIIKGTRPFCKEKDGEYFHVKEAAEWVIQEWAGKFRNTTIQNILQVLGGYNCQHLPAYRSLINIPIDVIQRNIDNGNFVPSQAEKSLLNL